MLIVTLITNDTACLLEIASCAICSSIHQFQVTSIDGQKVDLAKYKGKVLLIVNVASECGYTDQYKAMQALHAKHAEDGLAILGKDSAPLYQFLMSKDTNPKHAGKVEWNFVKFIIGRDGAIAARFAADVEPDSDELMQALRQELNKKSAK
jgi:glutathione peroxidase